MADRNLNFDPTVTNVTPSLPDQGLMTGAADLADKIATVSANTKALAATAQVSFAYRQLDEQYRQAAASNPNDPQALADLQSARTQVVAQFGKDVPAIASQEFNIKAIELGQSSDKMNELWGMHQQVRNADNNMSTFTDTKLKQANMDGIKFGEDGADFGNLNSVLNYESAQDDIKKFVVPIVGEPKADAFLKDFSGNYVKSFVAGVAERNPQAAAAMLERPEIAEHFTTQQIGDMADVIKRTTRQQELIKNMQVTKNDGSLADIINDPDTSYLEKRSTIDRLDASGSVTPKAAAAARRVIKSTEDLDSQTDTPFMADIVNQAYDLNANATTNSDDYLRGVQNLHNKILEGQAAGNLTGRDASKVTKTVNNLTSKKLADATNTAGMEFYDANQKFNALPPEYRGQATRALFYAGDGKNWTPSQYSNQATQIMQQINDQRRQGAQKTLGAISQDDTEFLKSVPNATPAAIQATATKYGISTKQVVLQLRAKAVAAMRLKQNGIKRIAPNGGEEEPGDQGSVTIPEKPRSGLTPTDSIDSMEESGELN